MIFETGGKNSGLIKTSSLDSISQSAKKQMMASQPYMVFKTRLAAALMNAFIVTLLMAYPKLQSPKNNYGIRS
jgi:hypothetical protein